MVESLEDKMNKVRENYKFFLKHDSTRELAERHLFLFEQSAKLIEEGPASKYKTQQRRYEILIGIHGVRLQRLWYHYDKNQH